MVNSGYQPDTKSASARRADFELLRRNGDLQKRVDDLQAQLDPVPHHTGWVAATGWSLTDTTGWRISHYIQLRVVFSRTGADIVLPTTGPDNATGNITNVNICTTPISLRGNIDYYLPLVSAGTGRISGGVYQPTTGTIQVVAVAGTANIITGQSLSLGGMVLIEEPPL